MPHSPARPIRPFCPLFLCTLALLLPTRAGAQEPAHPPAPEAEQLAPAPSESEDLAPGQEGGTRLAGAEERAAGEGPAPANPERRDGTEKEGKETGNTPGQEDPGKGDDDRQEGAGDGKEGGAKKKEGDRKK